MMTSKPFSNMSPRSEPSGNEWSSVASYMFKHHEQMMVIFFHALDQDVDLLRLYLVGMCTTLAMLEDNGMPSDFDEVIHNWDHEEPFDIVAAIRLAHENL